MGSQVSSTPTLPSAYAELNPKGILSLSDANVQGDFFPSGVSHPNVPDETIASKWWTYLKTHDFDGAFMPLRGTERSRYGPIIQTATKQDKYELDVANNTLLSIPLNQLQSRFQIDNSNLSNFQRYGPTRPVAVEDITEFGYRPERHIRQRPQFSSAVHNTIYGPFITCNVFPSKEWYIGHRPGDPVVRVDKDPSPGPSVFDNGDIVDVLADFPELGNDNSASLCKVHFEGVVPFNRSELLQRFTEYAFPQFAKMVIAMIAFDPLSMERGIHPWATTMSEDIDIGFHEFGARKKKNEMLRVLLKLWRMKYGPSTDSYPRFLRCQIDSCISAFREVGWLLAQLRKRNDHMSSTHFWSNCKNLVQKITGSKIEELAAQHRDIQLAGEAETMLKAGELDDIVFYTRNSDDDRKIDQVYDCEGPKCSIEFQQVLEVRQKHRLPMRPIVPYQQQLPAPSQASFQSIPGEQNLTVPNPQPPPAPESLPITTPLHHNDNNATLFGGIFPHQ